MISSVPKWPKRARAALWALLLLTTISETTALAFYTLRIGHDHEQAYFQGTAEDDESDVIFYPKSLMELLEVAHPHSFGFVMFCGLLLFIATAFPVFEKWYLVWATTFTCSVVAFMALPFLIRFVSASLSGGYGICGALISAHVYAFIGAGIWSLTRPKQTESSGSTS
ncbi:MAG: hypothetical protein KDC35_02415 [Acidobacteria bacterium]|nr:hypothetical protein [Acidobacteriota bacterium]